MFEKIKSFFIVSEEVRLKNMTNNVVIWKMIKLIFWGSLFGGLALYALLKPIINPPTTQIESLVLTMIACIFFGAIMWAYGGTFLKQIFNEFLGKDPNEITEKDTLILYLNKTTHKFSPQVFELLNQLKLNKDEKSKNKLLVKLTNVLDSEILDILESRAASDDANFSENINPRLRNNYLRLIMHLANVFIEGFDPRHPYASAKLIEAAIDFKLDAKTIGDYIKDAYALEVKEKNIKNDKTEF